MIITLFHKLRRFILKQSRLTQSTLSKLDSSHPQWALFERMDYANKLYNQPSPVDFTQRQTLYKQRNQTIVKIMADNFTEQHLVDAIQSIADQGGEIRLPAGKLVLSQTLDLPSGVHLIGIVKQTEIVFVNCDYGISIQGTPEKLLNEVALHNLKLYHEGEHKFCAALFATCTQALHLENIEIISPRSVGVLFADHVYQTKLINCHVKHAGLVGFMFIRDVRETLMKDCSAEYCQQSGIFLTDLKLPKDIAPLDFSAQLDYTNNVIGNFAPFDHDDPSPYRTDIISCIFSHNRKMGITTDGAAYLMVRNCIISNNDCEGITIDNGAWGCLIQNCHIYNNGWRGLQHEVELGIDFVDEMGLMADGSSKAKLPGISLDNAAYTQIVHNHIECNWGDGIKLVRATYQCIIDHNLIDNNNKGANDRFHYFGVLVGVAERQHSEQHDFASCNNRISGNTILGAHFAGIHLMTNVTGNVIEKNLIDGAVYEPIEIHAKSGNILVD